jgi:hypothetical protein
MTLLTLLAIIVGIVVLFHAWTRSQNFRDPVP